MISNSSCRAAHTTAPAAPPRAAGLPPPAAAAAALRCAMAGASTGTTYEVVLFYNYADVRDPAGLLARARDACAGAGAVGRLRVAPEGVNGTFAVPGNGDGGATRGLIQTLERLDDVAFRGVDWKVSVAGAAAGAPFVDLKTELRDVICSHGPEIPAGAKYTAEFGGKHLGPEEFDAALREAAEDPEAVVIDVRNGYEAAVGRFEHPRLLNPQTRSFSEWPVWVRRNREALKDKRVLMYCTGGIRCEKASAFLRATGVSDRVEQLQGGIHRYLEHFPDGGHCWKGENFVFDKRIGMSGEAVASSEAAAGACSLCSASLSASALSGARVCCVCRDLVLCCDRCWSSEDGGPDLHCAQHDELRACFRTRLARFTRQELLEQRDALRSKHADLLALKKRGKHKRKTLTNQLARVDAALDGDLLPDAQPTRHIAPNAGLWRDSA